MSLNSLILALENKLSEDIEASAEDENFKNQYKSDLSPKDKANSKKKRNKIYSKNEEDDESPEEQKKKDRLKSIEKEKKKSPKKVIRAKKPDTDHIKISTDLKLEDALHYEKFIDAINQLRAAGSFGNEDDENSEAEKYYQILSKNEKYALFIFLKGLTQLGAGGTPGANASSPAKYGIKMSKSATAEELQKSSKMKKDLMTRAYDTSGEEKDEISAENPIVVGEAQDKSKVISKFIIFQD